MCVCVRECVCVCVCVCVCMCVCVFGVRSSVFSLCVVMVAAAKDDEHRTQLDAITKTQEELSGLEEAVKVPAAALVAAEKLAEQATQKAIGTYVYVWKVVEQWACFCAFKLDAVHLARHC